MAQKLFRHRVTVTPGAAGQTQWEARIPANQRTLLKRIVFMPIGATSASAPLVWQLGIDAANGTFTEDSQNIILDQPAFSGSILTTVHVVPTVEPTPFTVVQFEITLHQQARLVWVPPTDSGFIIMDTGTRWGLRCQSPNPGFAVHYEFHLEE